MWYLGTIGLRTAPPVPRPTREAAVWWSIMPALRGFYDFIAENYSMVDSIGPQKWAVHRRSTSSVSQVDADLEVAP